MKINPNSTYLLMIVINSTKLTYTAKLIGQDDDFITFIDQYNKEYSFNKRNVISIEEIKKGDE